MKPTLKLAKEVAKRNGWTVRKDNDWNDIIVRLQDGSTLHFYDDMQDAIDTMIHLENKVRIQSFEQE